MYAVVKTGGKQYRVAKDDVIFVEKLAGEAGDVVELGEVLAMDDGKGLTVGAPLVDGARVAATVLEQKRADKVVIFKKKRRKNYRRTRGHRQQITVLRISEFLAKGQKAAAAPAKADDSAPEGAAPDAGAKAKGKAKTKAKTAKAKTAKTKKAKASKKAPAKGAATDTSDE